MSASEKLRALERYREWGYPTDRNGNHVDDQVLNALPQIRALVETAEVMMNPDGIVRHGDMSFQRLTPAEVLGPTLAALDEALGEQA